MYRFIVCCVFFCLVAGEVVPESPKAAEPETKEILDASKTRHTVVLHETPMLRRPKDVRVTTMRSKAGVKYECVIPEPGQQIEEPTEPEVAAPSTELHDAATTVAPSLPPLPLPTMKDRLEPLLGRCIIRNEGYWNYEVCHGKMIRQFHIDSPTERTEYSLGLFTSESEEPPTDESRQDGALVHQFVGGTPCDETKTGRRTEVRYRCGGVEKEQIISIMEKAVCSYVITVVGSALCMLPHPTTVGSDASAAATSVSSRKPVKARDYLSPLATSCFFRVETWWTYELCYGKHVRQFHQENNNQVTSAEFILGKMGVHPTAEAEPVKALDPADTVYSQTYDDGTVCDVTNRPRKTEVQFMCSKDSHNVISSIKERSSCEYVLVFKTPLLCSHPAFRVQEDPLVTIDCYRSQPSPAPVQ